MQMDILWHLSLREGLPRSVVQALACGKAACGYALDGTPEVILNGETGCCVPAREYETIARKSAELLQDRAMLLKMGQNGRELVKTRFDKERMARYKMEKNLFHFCHTMITKQPFYVTTHSKGITKH